MTEGEAGGEADGELAPDPATELAPDPASDPATDPATDEQRDRLFRGTPVKRPSRRNVTIVVSILVGLAIAGTLSNIFLAPLRREHPLVVLLLDARNRQLLLLSDRMGTATFVIVGVLRRMFSDPLYYLLGYWYGENGVRWMEQKLGGGPLVGTLEKGFAKAAPLMVFLFPGVPVCVLAGATGMRPRVFFAWNFAGTITAVVGLRLTSRALKGPLSHVTSFIDNNAKWFALVAIASSALLFLQQRKTGTGEIQALTDLANDGEPDVDES